MNWKKWIVKRVAGVGGASGQVSQKQSVGSWIGTVLSKGVQQMTVQNTEAAKLLDEVVAKMDAAIGGSGTSSTPAGSSTGGTATVVKQAAEAGTAPASGGAGAGGTLLDAIDREIAAQPLQTAVASVRGSDVVEQFRRELETQSLTVTTVTAFLQILQQVLPLLLAK